MKSILDRTFRYVPSTKTDLAATFRRIRREQEAAKQEREEKVKPLERRKA